MRAARSVVLLVAAAGVSACVGGPASPLPSGAEGYELLESHAVRPEPGPYRLRAGDVVSVAVFGEEELSSRAVTLDERGNVLLPLIGELAAAGRSAAELRDDIAAAYGARYLRDPVVTVAVEEARSQLVTVEGQVEQPGAFPYAEGQTLLSALALARSPTELAALSDVAVFRTVEGRRFGGRFDVRAIRAGAMPDLALQPGDLVVVGLSSQRAALRELLRNLPLVGALAPL
jgi:polysaccharide export outer membrane protein